MSSRLDPVWRQLIDNSITSVLKPMGYKRRGYTYTKQFAEVSWLLDIQRSQWNTADALSFTLNIGIFIPGFTSRYGTLAEPAYPKVVDCCIYSRIGQLTTEKRDIWWEIHDSKDSDNLIMPSQEDIRTIVQHTAIPFFDRFHKISDVIAYLETPRPEGETQVWPSNPPIIRAYTGILYYLKNERAKCCENLMKANSLGANKPGKEHFEWLVKRYCND